MGVEGQVRVVNQQHRLAFERTVVVINARAQLAAQPGMEEHPLQLGAELPLPALFQLIEQRHQQSLAHGACGVERHDLVETIIEAALGQLTDGFNQGMTPNLPVAAGCFVRRTGCIKQWLDLADSHAAVEPQHNLLDPLNMLCGKQPMPLGGAMGDDQSVATLPGTQGHCVDPRNTRNITYGQPTLCQCLAVVRIRCVGHNQVVVHGQMALRRLRFSGCGCRYT